MTKPGPKPTPTAILKLAGSTVPGRSRKGEPEPASGTPAKPEWVVDATESVWNQTIKHLSDMRVLTVADGNAIARYCELVVSWVEVSQKLRDHGMTYDLNDKNGEFRCSMPRPEVSIRNQLTAQIICLEREFGLTPSSRASLKVEPTSKTSPVPSRQRIS